MSGTYLAGAIFGGLIAGLGITAMLMWEERKSGRPSELIELQRATTRRLNCNAPSVDALPTAIEQAIAQGGHLLLSVAAAAIYGVSTDGNTNPIVGGITFGFSFYAIAHWLIGPALGVKAPEWESDGKTIGMHTLTHATFGLITAFAAWTAVRL